MNKPLVDQVIILFKIFKKCFFAFFFKIEVAMSIRLGNLAMKLFLGLFDVKNNNILKKKKYLTFIIFFFFFYYK
jgi:hypothetical protein